MALYYTAVAVVDMWIDHCIAIKKQKFTAWELGQWIAQHPDSKVSAWTGQASQVLQQHRVCQQYSGLHNGLYTRHRCRCERKGPDAPWFVEYDGSWKKAHTLNWAEKMRFGFMDDACCSMPMAKAEDARNGHVKLKVTDKDGPALKACKAEITKMGYGVNAALVAASLKPIDIPALLARF